MSVNVSRAFPEIDGFKPSHRKLLYTMYKMGLLKGERQKSANIVGQTMKLNPHGDAAIYETMVRLATGNEALLALRGVEGQLWQVLFGRSELRRLALYRAKLSPISAEIFKDIDKDPVTSSTATTRHEGAAPATHHIPQHPRLGQQGHRRRYGVRHLRFQPQRGLYCHDALPQGSRLRSARVHAHARLLDRRRDHLPPREMERLSRPAWQLPDPLPLALDSRRAHYRGLRDPYTTKTDVIIERIVKLSKEGKVKEIADIRDETDLSGLRIAIDLKRGVDPDKLMAKLYRSTTLQDSFSCNFNVLVDGYPRVMGVRQILHEWVKWRIESTRRRINFDLGKKSERLHLLHGLEQSCSTSTRPSPSSVAPSLKPSRAQPYEGFDIDETQAEFVAELKLRNINEEYILNRTKTSPSLRARLPSLRRSSPARRTSRRSSATSWPRSTRNM